MERVTADSYTRFKQELNALLGLEIQYRVCEMPIIVSHEFRQQMEEAAVEIIKQCASPAVYAHSEPTMQDRYRVRNENDRPLFSVVDFAVCPDGNGGFMPRVIELQGFPSLFGYQYLYAARMRDFYGLDEATPFMGDIADEATYLEFLRAAIYNDEDPELCALVEVDPLTQKTRPDFVALEQLIGLRTVNIRDVRKHGRSLVVDINGNTRPLKRIFNRAIIDELDDLGVTPDFAWSDDLDVAWAGHPNWYFRISKYCLPYLKHETVPTTLFLNQVTDLPNELSGFVLKPLYSFAGKGVVIGPSHADIDAIETSQRDQWILQERVNYADCIATPFGDNKVELRLMMVWLPDAEDPIPIMSLARTGRGLMMGARYNTDPWTGSSGCLFI
jgi:hypothetical protein